MLTQELCLKDADLLIQCNRLDSLKEKYDDLMEYLIDNNM